MGYRLETSAIMTQVKPVTVDCAAIESDIPAVMTEGIKVAIPSVAGDVETIMTDIHPVITNVPAIAESRPLGLGSSGGEDQADCE